MRAIADAIGFNLVVISPTIALVLTALILSLIHISEPTRLLSIGFAGVGV